MSVLLPVLANLALKGLLLSLAGFALAALLRRQSAALRHDTWLTLLACCALLPLAAAAAQAIGGLPAVGTVGATVGGTTLSVVANGGEPGRVLQQVWTGARADGGLGWLGAALVWAWLAGAALAASRSAAAHRTAARIARRAAPAGLPGTPRGLRVRITNEVGSPAVFGALRPVVLLPQAARLWPRDRLTAVLAHEAAHVARRDGLLELVIQLACAVHWFNPLVWAAARRLRRERELACDERVLADGIDPRAYAASLVEVARSALDRLSPPALIAMARTPELERRVLVLLAAGPRRRDRPGRRTAAALAAVTLFVPLAALTTPEAAGLAPGSVQPASGPLSGLDDPMSERVPLDYRALAVRAAAVAAEGPNAAAIAGLKAELGREPKGYGDLVRERAIWTLGEAEDGRLFEPLARRLGDRDWRIRAYAAWGLAAVGDERATPLLMPMLKDPVWRVRAMAAAALAELGDPRAAGAIAAAARDRAWQVRIGVLGYAARLDDPALDARLRPLLDDPHWGTRSRAQQVLGNL